MKLRELIQDLIQESLLIEESKKDRFILRRKDLTDEQKQEIIDYLDAHNDGGQTEARFVKSVNGDWNKFNKVSWAEIKDAMNYESRKVRKMKIKSEGINNLEKNEDYIPITVEYDPSVDIYDLNKQTKHQATGFEKLVGVYIPLNYEASKFIGKEMEPCRAHWCTTHTTQNTYWKNYTEDGDVLIYVIYEETKYAILTYGSGYRIWDELDKPNSGANGCNLPGIDVEKLIKSISGLIKKASEIIIENNEDLEPSYYIPYDVGDPIDAWTYHPHGESEEVRGTIVDIGYTVGDDYGYVYFDFRYVEREPEDIVIELNGERYIPESDRESGNYATKDDIKTGDIVSFIGRKNYNDGQQWKITKVGEYGGLDISYAGTVDRPDGRVYMVSSRDLVKKSDGTSTNFEVGDRVIVPQRSYVKHFKNVYNVEATVVEIVEEYKDSIRISDIIARQESDEIEYLNGKQFITEDIISTQTIKEGDEVLFYGWEEPVIVDGIDGSNIRWIWEGESIEYMVDAITDDD
jgi:hypothetical protein